MLPESVLLLAPSIHLFNSVFVPQTQELSQDTFQHRRRAVMVEYGKDPLWIGQSRKPRLRPAGGEGEPREEGFLKGQASKWKGLSPAPAQGWPFIYHSSIVDSSCYHGVPFPHVHAHVHVFF